MSTLPFTTPAGTARLEPAGRTARLNERVDIPETGVPVTMPLPGKAPAVSGCLLGECLDASHPTLTGRVLVRWSEARGEREQWVPTLLHLPVRPADRVLLVQPANYDEPVVVGVLDGFTRRPEIPHVPAARLELKRGEAVRIAGTDGQELVELYPSDAGPVVRLLQNDVNLELPGALRLTASQIEIIARAGTIEIEASDEVNVRGEVVNLN